MADTFSNDLRLRLQESGSNAGTWGDLLNGTITNIASGFGQGSEAIPNASTHTITLADGTADEARSLYLKCTGGGQACTVTLGPNTISKVWIIDNATSYTLTFSQGSGANVAIAAGAVKVIATDGAGSGAAVVDTLDGLEGSLSTLAVSGTATMDGLTVNTSSVGGFKVTNEATSGVRLTAYQGTTNSNVRTAYVDAQEFVVSTGAPTGTTVTERLRLGSTGIIYVNGDGTGGRILGDGSGGLDLQDGNGRQTFRIMSPSSGSTQAMTLDADSNLMVGKTASDAATPGHELKADGAAWHTADSTFPLFLNRETNDGELIRFRRDNSNVGHIGVISGDRMYFSTSDGLGLQLDKDNNRIIPCDADGSYNDSVSLGSSGLEFKNLYVKSGGSNAGTFTAVGGYALQAYQDATSADHTALDLRSDHVSGGTNRYLIRGYNTAAGTPIESFNVNTAGGAMFSGDVGIGLSANIGAALHVDPATNVSTGLGAPLIKVGGANSWAGNGSIYSIGFGYNNSATSKSPAEIAFGTTTSSGFTKGDLLFATRNLTTDTAPITRMRISDVGALFVPYLRNSSAAANDVRFNTSNGEIYYQTSSERYKSNIVDLEFDTSNLYNLRPVSFDDNETGERCFGLIAEDTFEKIPEAVVTRNIGGETVPDSIPYSMLSVLIINEMKKLKIENDLLKERIEALENT